MTVIILLSDFDEKLLNDKGKPFERKGRKAMGLRSVLLYGCQAAELGVFLTSSIRVMFYFLKGGRTLQKL